MTDVILTTNESKDVIITRCSQGYDVAITEAPISIDVKVSGTVSSAAIDPLSGLSNLLTLYNVAKL